MPWRSIFHRLGCEPFFIAFVEDAVFSGAHEGDNLADGRVLDECETMGNIVELGEAQPCQEIGAVIRNRACPSTRRRSERARGRASPPHPWRRGIR